MWEYVNGIGSVVGLITGGFVIWERFYRYAPSAFLIAQPLMPGGVQMAVYLRVVNRSERPIIIKWPTGIKENELTIATDHSTRAIIGSLMDGETATAVDGLGDRLFPVHTPANFRQLDRDATVSVELQWSFAQPILYQHERKLVVTISKRAYEILTDEEFNDDEE